MTTKLVPLVLALGLCAPAIAMAQLGGAKHASTPTDMGGGSFLVTFTFVLENFSPDTLTEVQIVDSLDAAFPTPATYTVMSLSSSTASLVTNAGYDGSADTNLLDAASSTLTSFAFVQVTLVVQVTPNGRMSFSNQATVSALDGMSAPLSDLSDNGMDPDPNGTGSPSDPGEDDPTSITFPIVAPPDAGPSDAGPLDLGPEDAGAPDAGDPPEDAMVTDAASTTLDAYLGGDASATLDLGGEAARERGGACAVSSPAGARARALPLTLLTLFGPFGLVVRRARRRERTRSISRHVP